MNQNEKPKMTDNLANRISKNKEQYKKRVDALKTLNETPDFYELKGIVDLALEEEIESPEIILNDKKNIDPAKDQSAEAKQAAKPAEAAAKQLNSTEKNLIEPELLKEVMNKFREVMNKFRSLPESDIFQELSDIFQELDDKIIETNEEEAKQTELSDESNPTKDESLDNSVSLSDDTELSIEEEKQAAEAAAKQAAEAAAKQAVEEAKYKLPNETLEQIIGFSGKHLESLEQISTFEEHLESLEKISTFLDNKQLNLIEAKQAAEESLDNSVSLSGESNPTTEESLDNSVSLSGESNPTTNVDKQEAQIRAIINVTNTLIKVCKELITASKKPIELKEKFKVLYDFIKNNINSDNDVLSNASYKLLGTVCAPFYGAQKQICLDNFNEIDNVLKEKVGADFMLPTIEVDFLKEEKLSETSEEQQNYTSLDSLIKMLEDINLTKVIAPNGRASYAMFRLILDNKEIRNAIEKCDVIVVRELDSFKRLKNLDENELKGLNNNKTPLLTKDSKVNKEEYNEIIKTLGKDNPIAQKIYNGFKVELTTGNKKAVFILDKDNKTVTKINPETFEKIKSKENSPDMFRLISDNKKFRNAIKKCDSVVMREVDNYQRLKNLGDNELKELNSKVNPEGQLLTKDSKVNKEEYNEIIKKLGKDNPIAQKIYNGFKVELHKGNKTAVFILDKMNKTVTKINPETFEKIKSKKNSPQSNKPTITGNLAKRMSKLSIKKTPKGLENKK